MKLIIQLLLVIFISVLFSCNQTSEKSSTELLIQKLDSMNKKIDSLQAKMQPNKDTIENTPKVIVKDSLKTVKKKTPTPIKKEPSKTKTQVYKPSKEIFYYTNSKQPSLIIEPWANEKRKLYFYNRNGELTYTQEDVHMSYSISTTVKGFHSNGAVKSIEIHFNPGASLYMYQSTITFDEDNVPLWKNDTQWPSRMEDIKPPSYWDRKEKVWKQQEAIKEQPLPNN